MFKKRTGHRDAKCVEGKEDWEVGIPSLVHQIRRSILAAPAGSGSKPPRKTILVHFVPEEPSSVNRILLHVVKCCIIKMIK